MLLEKSQLTISIGENISQGSHLIPSPHIGYMDAKWVSQGECLKPCSIVQKGELSSSEGRESSEGPGTHRRSPLGPTAVRGRNSPVQRRLRLSRNQAQGHLPFSRDQVSRACVSLVRHKTCASTLPLEPGQKSLQ